MKRWHQLATAQGGVVTGRQLDEAGMSRYQRARLWRDGQLEHAGRDVWRLAGWPATWRGDLWGAVLASGPAALAYRRSAAAWWGLDAARQGGIEVAVPSGHHPRARGVRVHRVASLGPSDVIVQEGMRVTTVARTLADLGGVVAGETVERAMESALRRRLVAVEDLVKVGEGLRTPGARALLRVLRLRPEGAVPTGSDAETRFLQLSRAAGLSDPERQLRLLLGGRWVLLDFGWRRIKLAVEIDGAEVHARADSLGADLRRQNRIVLDGWHILRFTWEDVVRYPAETTATLLLGWELAFAWSLG